MLFLEAATFEKSLIISANGEDGKPGVVPVPGDCDGPLGITGGGGGGGAGGTVFIRSLNPVIASIGVRGGLGANMLGDANHCHDGGRGSPGRVRIDAPRSDLFVQPVMPPYPIDPYDPVARGPAFIPGSLVTTRPFVELGFYADDGFFYLLSVNGADVGVAVAAAGVGTTTADLLPGHNEVCVGVPADSTMEVPEAWTCRDLVYVPR
jgi:hypothetical protein